MPIYAINTAAVKNFVSKLDTARDGDGNPLPEATVWKLGAMDSYIQAHTSSKATSYSIKEGVELESLKDKSDEEVTKSMEYNVDAYTMAIETCRYCLRGWENFIGPNGKRIKFKTVQSSMRGRMYDVVDSDLLAKIPKDVLLELYVVIEEMSTLSEKKAKNSGKG